MLITNPSFLLKFIDNSLKCTIGECHQNQLFYQILTDKLNTIVMFDGWVPKMLVEEYKTNIMTGNETSIAYYNPETDRQSSKCPQSKYHSTPRKLKQKRSTQNIVTTACWDRNFIFLIKFPPRRIWQYVIAKFEIVGKALKRRHSASPPQFAALTTTQLVKFRWKLLDHPPYSLDLAPSDFSSFSIT